MALAEKELQQTRKNNHSLAQYICAKRKDEEEAWKNNWSQ
jgi:hypothetical protein